MTHPFGFTQASHRWRVMSDVVIGVLIASLCLGLVLIPNSFAIAAPTRPLLTPTLLAERIAAPIHTGGRTLIDLSDLTIDLRANDAIERGGQELPFSEQFYRQLQAVLSAKRQTKQQSKQQINNSGNLGLDLSGSLIQGDLDLSKLSRRIPAYGDAILPELEAFKQTFQLLPAQGLASGRLASGRLASERLASERLTAERLTAGGRLLRRDRRLSGRLYPDRLSRFLLPQVDSVQPDTLVFPGPLILNQACFNGKFDASNLYLLGTVEAEGTIFTQLAQWQSAKFAQNVLFKASQFQQESNFRSALFAKRVWFSQARFGGVSQWKDSRFWQTASFADADFQSVIFDLSHWHKNADFERASFHRAASFQKSRFDQALFLTDALLEGSVNLRQAQFQRSISLRAAHVLGQVDFGDARFAQRSGNLRDKKLRDKVSKQAAEDVTINVADLDFSAGTAKILGSPGQMGVRFAVPTLTSNETVMRNLIRNFRSLEQIGDANQLEYKLEILRLAQIKRQLLGVGLNQATETWLVRVGFAPEQAQAVVARAAMQPFVSRSELLELDEVDLATYLQVRDHLTTRRSNLLTRGQHLLRWLLLAGLLQLSSYGTNVGLVFSVGLVAVTLFALMFWLVDRARRLTPTPILPPREEMVWMGVGGSGLLVIALSSIFQSSDRPIATLATLALLSLPIPGLLILRLYQQGRYHDLMDRSYFVENGALRRLQVLIARLPIPPRFPFFRDRYRPLLIDRRWNWLNYFDFSLNNWFKFGFNDIRLRDRAVPGLISTLVWYQWSLGVIYITLLLWTLSRTIPGLNLLLYF